MLRLSSVLSNKLKYMEVPRLMRPIGQGRLSERALVQTLHSGSNEMTGDIVNIIVDDNRDVIFAATKL